MGRTTRLAAALAFVAAVVAPGTASAQLEGFERIRRYDVGITVLRSGRIHVVETIDYSFGTSPRRGIFRTIPVSFRYDDDHTRVYPLSDIKVTAGPGTPADTDVSTTDGVTQIRIGDPDRTITGDHTYVITYDVDGAINRQEGHDELYWNAVGHHWQILIEKSTVTVKADAAIDTVACFAGPDGAESPCRSARADGSTATFSNGLLGPFNGLSVVAALPHGYAARPGPILKERWTLRKAFSTEPEPLTAAGLALVAGLGVVGGLVWRGGRDRHYPGLTPGLAPAPGETAVEEPVPLRGRGEVSVDFEPGDDMRPALMGVLVDERADPLDVSATIVDLAVRRYLTIEELPREGWYSKADWRLTRLPEASAEGLLPWERKLLAALFRKDDTVVMSSLRTYFAEDMANVQAALYDDVVARGWFTRRPDSERGRWRTAGKIALGLAAGATYLLAKFTSFGFTGIALVLGALAMVAFSRRMPFRTGRGTAALDRARAFRRYLVTAEADQLRFEEREGIFARYLPYAIVMGETERWAKAFKDLGARSQQELYWYSAPSGWSPVHFGDSISSFSSTAGTIASTPTSVGGESGFSSGDSGGGGGGSGGGGGGGGGGSW